MRRREYSGWARGTLRLKDARERGDVDWSGGLKSQLMYTKSMIDRIGLEKELNGHMGCVNCLEWNHNGTILASASDDLHVVLWDPFRYKQLKDIATGHTGNIFSVKFLTPDTIATCAADNTVRVRPVSGEPALLECSCHCARVKRLATAPNNPHTIWSAAEDGLVLQHDLRSPHRCNSENPNVLVNLINHVGRYAEAKCVAINPRRPYQLALGANDFYVRLYDMRMIKLAKLELVGSLTRGSWERQNVRCVRAGHGDPDNNIPRAACHYYAPGHLSMEPSEHSFPKKATTYVTFSDDGNEILVNLGSEQVYIFDINSGRRPVLVESFIISANHRNKSGEKRNGENGTCLGESPPVILPRAVTDIKDIANALVSKGAYASAVELYNVTIDKCPNAAVLYSNRAAALMRRGWAGDTYAAVRDCYRAAALDPRHVKAHFRLAKALMDLRKPREAHESLLYFKDKFPQQANSHAVFLLQKDINVALEKMDTQPDDVPSESEENPITSVLEKQLRSTSYDYAHRFLGHCNTTTDIKEANFLGPDAQFVAAGSDDGSMFIWRRSDGNIIRILKGDESIVNCIQPHPCACLLATSGLESCVRLWSPRPEDGTEEPRLVRDKRSAAAANQQRMRSDPFEAMLLNISFAGGSDRHSPGCRPS